MFHLLQATRDPGLCSHQAAPLLQSSPHQATPLHSSNNTSSFLCPFSPRDRSSFLKLVTAALHDRSTPALLAFPYLQGSLYSIPTIKLRWDHCFPIPLISIGHWILTNEFLHQKIHKCSYCVKILTVSCIILHDPHRSYQICPREIRLEGWQGRRKKWERQETRELMVGGRWGKVGEEEVEGRHWAIRFHALYAFSCGLR